MTNAVEKGPTHTQARAGRLGRRVERKAVIGQIRHMAIIQGGVKYKLMTSKGEFLLASLSRVGFGSYWKLFSEWGGLLGDGY
jgi:hypothetical protein